jgi:hypothetical protein
MYLRSSNLRVLGSWGAGGLARHAHIVSSLAGIDHSVGYSNDGCRGPDVVETNQDVL